MNTTELINDLAKVKAKQKPLWEHLHFTKHPKAKSGRSCGSYLELREWLEHEGKCTVTTANFCKHHIMCNTCAIRRSARLCKEYEAKIEEVLAQPQHADLIPVMLTFTVKNQDSLPDVFDHIRGAFTKMTKAVTTYRTKKKKPAIRPEMEKVQGAVYAVEIKRGKGGQWPPHIHCFALLSEYIDQSKLRDQWFEATGDSFVVGVTECKNGILAGLIEVLKYTTKFSEMTPPDIVHIADTVRHRTLCAPLGILRGVTIRDINEDSTEGLDGEYIDYIAHFLYSKSRYSLKLKSDVHDDVISEGERRMEEEKRIRLNAKLSL